MEGCHDAAAALHLIMDGLESGQRMGKIERRGFCAASRVESNAAQSCKQTEQPTCHPFGLVANAHLREEFAALRLQLLWSCLFRHRLLCI